MKAKHAYIDILKTNPFENYKFQHKPHTDVLCIIQNYTEGFVLAC